MDGAFAAPDRRLGVFLAETSIVRPQLNAGPQAAVSYRPEPSFQAPGGVPMYSAKRFVGADGAGECRRPTRLRFMSTKASRALASSRSLRRWALPARRGPAPSTCASAADPGGGGEIGVVRRTSGLWATLAE